MDRSMEMVNINEMEQIIHDEEMKVRKAKLKPIQEKIRQQDAEDKELFKWKDYTLTDVGRKVNPPRSKILDLAESSDRMTSVHALGYMHGMYLRISAVALLWFVYVFL